MFVLENQSNVVFTLKATVFMTTTWSFLLLIVIRSIAKLHCCLYTSLIAQMSEASNETIQIPTEIG